MLFTPVWLWLAVDSGLSGGDLRRMAGQSPKLRTWSLLPAYLILAMILQVGVVCAEAYAASQLIHPGELVAPEKSSALQYFDRAFESTNIWMIVAYVGSGFLVVVIGPVTEEVLFRGILLTHWSSKWNLKWAAILSSVTFASYHQSKPAAFAFGLVMVALYLRTQCLAVPIACHVIGNALSLATALAEDLTAETAGSSLLESDPTHLLIGAVMLLGISAPWLIWLLRGIWSEDYRATPYFASVDLGRERHKADPGK